LTRFKKGISMVKVKAAATPVKKSTRQTIPRKAATTPKKSPATTPKKSPRKPPPSKNDHSHYSVEHKVEKILGKKTIKKQLHYLVQWAGYDESANSWEPEKNVANCVALDDFEATEAEDEQEDEQDETFQVEKILSSKTVKGKTEYLVKWQGYDDSWNTWEPKENLDNCQTLLSQFKRTNKK